MFVSFFFFCGVLGISVLVLRFFLVLVGVRCGLFKYFFVLGCRVVIF